MFMDSINPLADIESYSNNDDRNIIQNDKDKIKIKNKALE